MFRSCHFSLPSRLEIEVGQFEHVGPQHERRRHDCLSRGRQTLGAEFHWKGEHDPLPESRWPTTRAQIRRQHAASPNQAPANLHPNPCLV